VQVGSKSNATPEDKVREVSQQKKKNGTKVPDLQYQKHHCTKFEPFLISEASVWMQVVGSSLAWQEVQ